MREMLKLRKSLPLSESKTSNSTRRGKVYKDFVVALQSFLLYGEIFICYKYLNMDFDTKLLKYS